MKTKNSKEFKESIIARLLPPQNARVSDVSRETGVPKDTLYTWRIQYRNSQNRPIAGSGRRADKFTNEEKLAVIIETDGLNELELGKYCRLKGLYPEQISGWKKSIVQGGGSDTKKVPSALGGSRGRKIELRERQEMIRLIEDACALGARLTKACQIVGLSPRTIQRYRQGGTIKPDGRKAAAGRVPANRLSNKERQEVLITANQPQYANLPPSQIVPALADDGYYLASESNFYRILREEKQLEHRGRAKAPTRKRPETVQATAPNQLWSWDITYLSATVKGIYFYLYLIMDVYSRKIVGWDIYAEESTKHASNIFSKAYLREGIAGNALVLHSDKGSPMKGATMLGSLQKLGVTPSFSRPSVSNDNPTQNRCLRH